MTIYTLDYANGRTDEIEAENDEDAEAEALDRVGTESVACDYWEAAGWNDNDPIERLWIWERKDDSIDDAGGANAIAELTVVRRRRTR